MQHEVGSIVEGKVTGITKFGAFVELEGGSVGMVHISEVSQSYVNDISEHLKEQQMVKVKILNIGDNGKISLSIKRALPQQQNPFPKRENRSSNSGNRGGNGGGGRPSSKPGGNRSEGYSPANRGGAPVFQSSRSGPAKENSFEDMLSKFIKSSDEKFSDMKKPQGRRRGGRGRKDSRDYN